MAYEIIARGKDEQLETIIQRTDLMVVLGGKLIVEAEVPTSAADYGLSRFNDADEHGVLNTRIRAQMPAHMRGGADSNFRPDTSLPPYHAETITRIMFSGGVTKPLNGEILPCTPSEAAVELRTYLEEETLLAKRYPLYRQRIERVGPATTILDEDATKTIHTISKSIDYARAHGLGVTAYSTTGSHRPRVTAMLTRALFDKNLLRNGQGVHKVEEAEWHIGHWDDDMRVRYGQLAINELFSQGTVYAHIVKHRYYAERMGLLALACGEYYAPHNDDTHHGYGDEKLNGDTDKLYRTLATIFSSVSEYPWYSGYKDYHGQMYILKDVVDFWSNGVRGFPMFLSLPAPWYEDERRDPNLAATTFLNLWLHGFQNVDSFKLPGQLQPIYEGLGRAA